MLDPDTRSRPTKRTKDMELETVAASLIPRTSPCTQRGLAGAVNNLTCQGSK